MKNKILLLGIVFMLLSFISVFGAECEIREISHNQLNIGDYEGLFQFQVVDPNAQTANDTLLHATCSLNLYAYGESYDSWSSFGNITGNIIDVYKREELHHGVFSNVLGDFTFNMDLDSYSWQPNTVYAYQVECYCLDLDPQLDVSEQDIHVCHYGSSGARTGYMACSRSGNFTTGDEIVFEKKNTYLNIWLLLAALFVVSSIGYAFKDKGLFSISGVIMLFTGLVILRSEIPIEGLNDITQPAFGLILTLVGFYIIIWAAVRKFFKPKEQDDDIVIEKDYK